MFTPTGYISVHEAVLRVAEARHPGIVARLVSTKPEHIVPASETDRATWEVVNSARAELGQAMADGVFYANIQDEATGQLLYIGINTWRTKNAKDFLVSGVIRNVWAFNDHGQAISCRGGPILLSQPVLDKWLEGAWFDFLRDESELAPSLSSDQGETHAETMTPVSGRETVVEPDADRSAVQAETAEPRLGMARQKSISLVGQIASFLRERPDISRRSPKSIRPELPSHLQKVSSRTLARALDMIRAEANGPVGSAKVASGRTVAS